MQTLTLPPVEYDKTNIGQTIEDFSDFSKSIIEGLASAYWDNKVMGSLDKSRVFNLATHRLAFIHKLAQLTKEFILLNKKPGELFVIRDCGCGNGIFDLKFLKELKKLFKTSRVNFNEIKYELVDFSEVIEKVKKSGLLSEFSVNMRYSPLDLVKNKSKKDSQVDLIFMNYIVACFPATILKIDKKKKLFRREIRVVYIGPKKLSVKKIQEIKTNLKNKEFKKIPAEIKAGLIAEIRDKKASLAEFSGKDKEYIESQLKNGQPTEIALPNLGAEIIDKQLADLKPNGHLVISDFGPSPLSKLNNYSFVNSFFQNAAYPVNFFYLKGLYPNSKVVTDKRIVSFLVAKNKSGANGLFKKFKQTMEPNVVRETNRLLRKVNLLIRVKNETTAQKLLTKLSKLDSSDDQLLMEIAYCYYDLKDYAKAMEMVKKVIKLREEVQDLASAYFLLAKCLRLTGDKKKAEANLRKAITEGMNTAEAYSEKGYLDYTAGKISAALKDFDQSFKIKPSWSALINKFDCYRKQGEAVKGVEQVLINMVKEIDWRYLANPALKKEIAQLEEKRRVSEKRKTVKSSTNKEKIPQKPVK